MLHEIESITETSKIMIFEMTALKIKDIYLSHSMTSNILFLMRRNDEHQKL